MERFVDLILLNALLATGLAGAVALVTRWWRHPAIVHVLWLLVLAKLVTPAMIPVALLPAAPQSPAAVAEAVPEARPIASPARVRLPAAGPDSGLAPAENFTAPGLDLRRVLVLGNLAVAAGILLVAAVRFLRFRRRLSGGCEASVPVRRRAATLARGLGLRRVPRIIVTDATVPPLVAPGPRGTEIVLPAGLLAGLGAAERDSLLAHELAHVARGDVWIRPFELLVTALFWWHPIVWVARRRLRLAEEKACDALVLRALPGRGHDYAEGLLRTLEFLNERAPAPALATGADTSHLEERLTMIANGSSAKPLRRFRRAALALVGLGLLSLLPVARDSGAAVAETAAAPPAPAAPRDPAPPAPRAEPAPQVEPVPWVEPAPRAPGEPFSEAVVQLRQEEIALQRQLRELEIRRVRIEKELQEKQMTTQIGIVREELEHLVESGEQEAAEAMRRDLRTLESEAELQQARLQLDVDQATARLEIEERLQLLSLELDVTRARAEATQARAVEEEARALELQVQRQEIEAARQQIEFEAQEIEASAEQE